MKKLLYPKHYATVVEVGGPHIVVAPGRHSRRETLMLGWRCGWGHTGAREFAKGTVVKVYQRPQDAHPKFGRVGS